MAIDGSHPPAPVPHFHSLDQMLESVKEGIRVAQLAHLSCTEPMLIPLMVISPTGERLTLATASAQPSSKTRKRKAKDGQGGFHACHLFKHANAGIIPFLKDLLRRDHELKSAIVASPQYSLSKKGTSPPPPSPPPPPYHQLLVVGGELGRQNLGRDEHRGKAPMESGRSL